MSFAKRLKDQLRKRWSHRHNDPADTNTDADDLDDIDRTHHEAFAEDEEREVNEESEEDEESEEGEESDEEDEEEEEEGEDEGELTLEKILQQDSVDHSTTYCPIQRPPSPYPPSESSLAPHRSPSRNQYPRHPSGYSMDTSDQRIPSPTLRDTSHSQSRRIETTDSWLQRAIEKSVRLRDVSRRMISRRFTLFKQGTRTAIKRGFRCNRGKKNNTLTLQNEPIDESDLEDLDLRHFYDSRSEDPINRMIFIAGPEHFFHLAQQLETSPQRHFQLYGKELFIRSAAMGYAPAQFKLGICYELGLTHFPVDPSLSFTWYKRAAMQGHADAELAVSGWYLTGHPQGLIQSEPLAYEWASKAAYRGWSKAEYTLGHYHEVGIGVPQNLEIAKQWYIKAAAQGNERALLRLLVGHVGLDVDYGHLKDALLDQNQGNPYMIHQLAQFHELREHGLVPDEDAAFELYAASAQANYAPAQYRLGACYEFGILGCPQDAVQAVHWYRRGADNGHVEALLALAGFYLDGSAGRAAPQSDEEAFGFVEMAAQRGVPKAEYITGFFLEYGLGVEKNITEAKQWYHLACAKGVESAERRLMDLDRVAAAAGTTATIR